MLPRTRLMSQSIPVSNASTCGPLAVIFSLSSFSSWISCAVSARNTSPVPVTFINRVPSLVTAFFSIRDSPPEPACSKRTSPW